MNASNKALKGDALAGMAAASPQLRRGERSVLATYDTEALRARVTALALELRASRERIDQTVARARRRVQAQRRDRMWLDNELKSMKEREEELRRLLPELRRRDQQDADRHGV